MAKKLNLTQYPYFDDYKDSNKYYQILFRAGRAVQARELTQIQTMLQAQIERLGTHIFKQGSNVLPGTKEAVRYVPTVHFIKLSLQDVFPEYSELTSTLEDIDNFIKLYWIGKRIGITSGDKNGLTATVQGYRGPDNVTGSKPGGEIRFFIQMQSASQNGKHTLFEKGDAVTVLNGDRNISATIPTTEGQKKVGVVASATVEEGVYYYNGYFVYVDAQTIYLAPTSDETADSDLQQNYWNDTPTASIGLLMVESTKTYQQDSSLLDNATGTPNYSAPGADRFHIDAQLVQVDYTKTENKPENFISLIDVRNGKISFLADAPEYSVIMDTLAKRTYDESGDYVVENLGIEVKYFLRDDEAQNNGVHNIEEFQFLTAAAASEYGKQKFGTLNGYSGEYILHPSTGTQPGVDCFYYPGKTFDKKNDPISFKNLCNSYITVRVDPGKAYVKGYEIRKLGRSSIDIPKSRTTRYVANCTVQTPLGSYVYISDVSGNTALPNFINVDLYDRRRAGTVIANSSPREYTYANLVPTGATKIGTARIVKVEIDPSAGTGFYKAYLTDIKLTGTNTIDSVRMICSSTDGFYAHTVPSTFELEGTITLAAPNAANESVATGTGTKWKNYPGQILKANQYIYLDSTQEFYRVVSNPTSDNSITLIAEGTTVGVASPGSTFKGIYTELKNDTRQAGLVYSLPDQYVSSVRTLGTNNTDLSYSIEQLFSGNQESGLTVDTNTTGSSTFSTIQINLTDTGYKFSPNAVEYKLIRANASGQKVLSVEDKGALENTNTFLTDNVVSVVANTDLTTLTFYFNVSNAASTNKYFIMTPITKVGVKERKKILKSGSFNAQGYYEHSGNVPPFTPTTSNPGKGVVVVDASKNSEIYLGECDVYSVTRIVASKDAETEPTLKKELGAGDEDVTSLYVLDNGQTDYEYGYAKVTLRPNFSKPVGKIRVEFDYFEHEGADSDYFSVNSYTHTDGVIYDNIPFYQGPDGTNYPLSDCLDFRRKASDTKDGRAPIGFLTCSYSVYNPRVDKIVLDSKTKDFVLLQGTPAEFPVIPEDSDYGMTVAELSLNPYGMGAKESCILKPKDNRRYTMRDIGKLEKRIENLEYYTSLSMLEQETSRLKITDANGNDRFKNGFLADSFSSFDIADVSDSAFTCAIDTTEYEARPSVYSDFISLEEDLSNPAFSTVVDSLRNPETIPSSQSAYVKVGNVFMLPYERREFISQSIASKVVNVNPYAVFTYAGHVTLSPFSDVWRETKYTEIHEYDDRAYQDAIKNNNGKINYGEERGKVLKTVNVGKPYSLGTKLLIVGHSITDSWSPQQKRRVLAMGPNAMVRVPNDGKWANAGELVPVNIQRGKFQDTYISRGTGQKVTDTVEVIRKGFEQTVKKGGLLTTRAITKDETVFIEYMRSREIKFTGYGFKPNSELYAFFDDVPVSIFCRPVDLDESKNYTTYVVKDVTSIGDGSEIGIFPVDSPTRFLKAVTPSTFPSSVRRGCEVVYVTAAGITRKFDVINRTSDSILWCMEKNSEGILASQKGNLVAYPASTNVSVKISNYTYGDQIFADGSGSVSGVFRIPGDYDLDLPVIKGGVRFKTGEAKFTLTTSSVNAKTGSGISRGSADYSSRGVLNSQEVTVTQTQLFTVSSSAFNEKDTKTEERIKEEWIPENMDPIAQTFLVSETGGCFITDVEVFFAKKPTNGIPVKLEIRPVSNTGQPEFFIVGGSVGTVFKKAEDVVVNKVTINSTTSANRLQVLVENTSVAKATSLGGILDPSSGKIIWTGSSKVRSDSIKKDSSKIITSNVDLSSSDMSSDMIPTRFEFESPIYLEEGKRYAVVLLSDSNEYEVWVAQRGPYGPLDQNVSYGYYKAVGESNVKIGTTQSIDNQELYVNGDFFKSKNGFGWDIDPTVSIKFNLGKAVFKTRALPRPNTGEVVYVNQLIDWVDVPNGGLETRPGSSLIKVRYPNHGASIGDYVRFIANLSDVPNSDGLTTELRGFPKSAIEHINGLQVVSAEVDSFVVKVQVPGASAGQVVTHQASSTSAMAESQYKFGFWKTENERSIPTVKIQIDKRFDQLALTSTTFTPRGTSVEWTMQTTPGAGVHEYDLNGNIIKRPNTKLSPISIVSNNAVEFSNVMRLCAPLNEPNPSGQDGEWNEIRAHIQGKKSLLVKALLISNNENLSPVIESTRLGAALMSSRLDNPRGKGGTGIGSNINLSDIDANFYKVTIFDKNNIPSDPILKTISGTQQIVNTPRTPAYTASTGVTNFVNELSFSAATKVIRGTFTQDTNSKTIIGTNSFCTSDLVPGDKIIVSTDPSDERVVVKIVNDTKFIVNSPFSQPFTSKTLALTGQNLEITTTNSSVAAHLSQLDEGKYATLRLYTTTSSSDPIALTSDTRQFVDALLLNVEYTPNTASGEVKCKIVVQHVHTGTTASASAVTITQLDNYIDECAYQGNSTASRYICQKLNLDRPSTALRLSFDGIRDQYSDIELYYRTERSNDPEFIYTKNWIKAEYNIEVDGVLTPKSPEPDDSVYKEYTSTINALPEFVSVQAKVVFRGGNPANPPKIKNFRVIALDE